MENCLQFAIYQMQATCCPWILSANRILSSKTNVILNLKQPILSGEESFEKTVVACIFIRKELTAGVIREAHFIKTITKPSFIHMHVCVKIDNSESRSWKLRNLWIYMSLSRCNTFQRMLLTVRLGRASFTGKAEKSLWYLHTSKL